MDETPHKQNQNVTGDILNANALVLSGNHAPALYQRMQIAIAECYSVDDCQEIATQAGAIAVITSKSTTTNRSKSSCKSSSGHGGASVRFSRAPMSTGQSARRLPIISARSARCSTIMRMSSSSATLHSGRRLRSPRCLMIFSMSMSENIRVSDPLSMSL